MHRNAARRLSLIVSFGASFILSGASLRAAEDSAQAQSRTPTFRSAVRRGVSAPMRDYKIVGPVPPGPNREVRNDAIPKRGVGPSKPQSDAVQQSQFGITAPDLLNQYDGLTEDDNVATVGFGVVPPDTDGDVGPIHYVQYINSVWAVYDKATGALVLGPLPGNSVWASLGGDCEIFNDGDPIVKYDRMADRWVLTQFARSGADYHQCFAVSTTGDPTGAWYQYDFLISPDIFSDYPKLGIWPDAYYVTFNGFPEAGGAIGMQNAFDRSSMLNGDPAGMIAFTTPLDGGMLPSDLDGPTPPPAGSPNYFMSWWNTSPGTLNLYEFHVDWVTPSNSTFTGPTAIPVADFIYPVCGANRDRCVPQLGSADKLETLSAPLMYRLAYRNFGDHESLVTNHTVGTAGGNAGVRWYEIRDPGGAPTVYQQGTYAPDSSYRWMGSIAMDKDGNIALGYSKSDAAMHPAIAVTGRLAGDPLDTMGAEDVFFAGTGSQTGGGDAGARWGDYSAMAIDPIDDCTFWYTQEYYAETAAFDFKTRIGSFKFPSCTSGPVGMLEGTVTDGSSPVAGATVTATPSGSRPAAAGESTTTTDASGHYQFLALPAGTYDMAASKFGYASDSAGGVGVSDGGDTVQDFVLDPIPTVVVNGVVKDGSGHGWSLYAKLVVTGPSGFPGRPSSRTRSRATTRSR